jgi:hypothetical protein
MAQSEAGPLACKEIVVGLRGTKILLMPDG